MFPTVFAALTAAAAVADHWVQTTPQATDKGQPGWRGRRACAAHVATFTAAQAATLAVVCAVTGTRPRLSRVAAGLTVSAASHYIADRRGPLKRIATLVGREPLYQLGQPRPGRDDNPTLGTGAYALDQSWHTLWHLIAALIIAGRSPRRR